MSVTHEKICPREETAYTYLVGRIRALERGLLSNRLLDNVLKSEDLEQALRDLSELPYISEVLQNTAKNPPSIDRALTEHFWHTLNEIVENRSIGSIGFFFQMMYDFSDLKLILKQHLSNVKSEKEYPASFEWRSALRFIAGERTEFINDVYRNALDNALAGYESTQNVQIIENILDRAFLTEVKSLIDRCESQAVKNWLIAYFMFVYFRAAFRAKYQKTKIELFQAIYLKNPYVRFEDLSEIVTGGDEKPAEMLIHYGFRELLPHENEFRNDPDFLSEMEKTMDNYLMKLIRPFRIQAFGPEPVFGFLYAKMTDIRNLRILLHGKYFHVSEASIKRKLRECYYE